MMMGLNTCHQSDQTISAGLQNSCRVGRVSTGKELVVFLVEVEEYLEEVGYGS